MLRDQEVIRSWLPGLGDLRIIGAQWTRASDDMTILGAPFCQPGGSSDSDSDPSPQLPDAGGCVLSRPVLHITQPAERRRVEVYSGFPLLPISLRPFLLAGQCVQCVSVVLLL